MMPYSRNKSAPGSCAAEDAAAAGLRYVRDDRPGFRRVCAGKGFRYLDTSNCVLRDAAQLVRIRALVIPPAWTDVWICPFPNGHLQATGRDSRGRKQHRYHPKWRAVRDENKYGRLVAFARALPRIRARVELDLNRRNLTREKVLGLVVRLLETTLIRIGNEEYARQNGSFGLTTMRDRHAKFGPGEVRFEFRGKSGKVHAVTIRDRRLARVVQQCQDVPGQELFQYLDEQGNHHVIDSQDVNEYLRAIVRQEFSAKDFRTWAGTVLAACALKAFGRVDSKVHAKRNVVAAIESVAKRLGNTRSVCRSCYVHPAVIEAYLEGSLLQALAMCGEQEIRPGPHALAPPEAAVLAFLERRLRRRQNQFRNPGA